MANKTIKQLTTEFTSVAAADWLEGQRDSDDASGKIKIATLLSGAGAHPGIVPGWYYRPGGYGKQNLALGADQQLCYPIIIPRKVTIAGLALRTVTGAASSAVKAAIYSNVNGRPGAKIKELANPLPTTASASNIEEVFSGGNWVADPDIYWMAAVANGTPTVVCCGLAADALLSWLIGVPDDGSSVISADIPNLTGGSNYTTGHPSSFGAVTFNTGRAAPMLHLLAA